MDYPARLHFVLLASVVLAVASCSRETPAPPKSTMNSAPVITPPAVIIPASPPPPPLSTAVDPAATAKDSKTTNPTETMTKEQESVQMPMAGQANNHSSPAFEPKKP